MAAMAPVEERTRLARLVATARWISIAFGLLEARTTTPPPVSRLGMAGGLFVSAAYNLVAMRPQRFSPRGLEKLLGSCLVADFLVVSNSVALAANSPVDDGYLLYVLVALEAAV